MTDPNRELVAQAVGECLSHIIFAMETTDRAVMLYRLRRAWQDCALPESDKRPKSEPVKGPALAPSEEAKIEDDRQTIAYLFGRVREDTAALIRAHNQIVRLQNKLGDLEAPKPVLTDEMVERARATFSKELNKRGLFGTPIGKARIYDFREAMRIAFTAALTPSKGTPT